MGWEAKGARPPRELDMPPVPRQSFRMKTNGDVIFVANRFGRAPRTPGARVTCSYEAEAEDKTSETVIQKIFDVLLVP